MFGIWGGGREKARERTDKAKVNDGELDQKGGEA